MVIFISVGVGVYHGSTYSSAEFPPSSSSTLRSRCCNVQFYGLVGSLYLMLLSHPPGVECVSGFQIHSHLPPSYISWPKIVILNLYIFLALNTLYFLFIIWKGRVFSSTFPFLLHNCYLAIRNQNEPSSISFRRSKHRRFKVCSVSILSFEEGAYWGS